MDGIGGGQAASGGGSGYIDGEVDNFSALPAAASNVDKWYLVKNESGTWPTNYKGIGTYYSDGVSWEKKSIPAELTSAIGLNTVHRSSDGSDHSYIDQSVVSGASPNFNGENITNVLHGVHEDPSPELSGPLLARENNISFTPIQVVYNADTTIIDWSSGSNKAHLNLGGNITNLVFNDPPGPCNLLVKIKQSVSGSCTITNYGPAGSGDSDITWLTSDGNPPVLRTAANAVNLLMVYFDGTEYFGAYV